jgi:hypothetical protein
MVEKHDVNKFWKSFDSPVLQSLIMTDLIAPFHFNCWKHHLNWTISHIKTINMDMALPKFANISKDLYSIGNNVIDIYSGDLSVCEITKEIGAILKSANAYDRNTYLDFLGKQGYRKVKISDSSIWVLRFRLGDNDFIHIHPAKYSPYTFRTHANAWKTVLLVLFFNSGKTLSLDKSFINSIRTEFLHLPPVKNPDSITKINQIIKLIDSLSL